MSIEFHLGHQDHHKVEDFLARTPEGVRGIVLHGKVAQHQHAAAEAALEAGLEVFYAPGTARMAYPDPDGYLDKLPSFGGVRHDVDVLAASATARQEVVDSVLAAHPDQVTQVTPPSYFIDSERTAHLAVDLAEMTRLSSDKPVRPVLYVSTRLPKGIAETLAHELAAAQIHEVDLRISPTTGENDSIRKVKAVLATAQIFTDTGLAVTLGHSGNLGQVAVALGHVAHFSTGLGQNESTNFRAVVNRQVKPPKKKLDEAGKVISGGSWEGIYMPGLAMTVSRKTGQALLEHSDIRTRISCRLGDCANSIIGPLANSKTHYLHARAAEVATMLGRPEQWRAQLETDRLTRALELRRLVNSSYRRTNVPALKTRTLESLLQDITDEQQQVA
jgi:electron transfer flavoprotein alpha subunit